VCLRLSQCSNTDGQRRTPTPVPDGWGERFGKIALCGSVFAFGGLFPYRNRREGKTSGGGSAAAGAADKGI